MATLKQIRQRIRTAKNIQQITRAMKLVATARLKKATDRALAARPYSAKLQEFMESLAGAGGELPEHPLLEKRTGEDYCLILVTGERGLCGSYNTSVIRKASDFMAGETGTAKLITVGKKGNQFFGKRGFNMVYHHAMPSAGAGLNDGLLIAQKARELWDSGEVSKVYICYSKFYSAIRQVPQIVQLLPIEPEVDENADHGSSTMEFEPNAEGLLRTLLPRYFQTQVLQALLESTASGFAAQMTAMTNATENAGKMIQNLTLKANRERQAGITKEILEVVGGAEALKS